VDAGAGDHSVVSVDRSKDRISCGPGRDTAVVDQFDTTVGCDTVVVIQIPRTVRA
jgi:hypothetical protein